MLAALIAGLTLGAAPLPPQEQTPPPLEQGVTLEDVTVTGRRLEDLIEDFVDGVAAPNRGRGLARWNGGLCVGVANLRQDVGQYIVDRVSTVAEDVGLRRGAPGCTPRLLIVATEDGATAARALAEEHGRMMRVGGGTDQGRAAFDRFVNEDRPVRWWQIAFPVDADTGQRAVRLAGDCNGSCSQVEGNVYDYAPVMPVFQASRLTTQVVDDMFRAVVIVDVDQVSHLSIQQLADYIAMVSLAQIDPEADTSGYATILNLFDAAEGPAGLTDWDTAYLDGLYQSQRRAARTAANRTEVIDSIQRAHARARAEEQ